MTRKVAEARVIPWEVAADQWGVAIRYADGGKEAYPVGDRAAAEREIIRLTPPGERLRSV